MFFNKSPLIRYTAKATAMASAAIALSACTPPVSKSAFNDPYEPQNRKVHKFNKGLDRALVGPTAKGYGFITPPVLINAVDNAAAYLGLPGQAINNILQGDAKGFGQTVLTFTLNTLTFGIGDLAGNAGVTDNNADFGQTLDVWGFREGIYHEVPVLGPSTERDTIGFVVDTALNPTNFFLGDGIGLTFGILDRLGDRNEFSDVIEDTLYKSEDSYAAARSLYLQNRNFKLNNGVNEDSLEDPFADF
ncbi:VacJ family lipoprotein [Amylibacter sp. SFDW26]|uniref:MlaA family lipoprotein n=1 Tax=Amylibacter sp. SFDW26 TaxID=2652722 RepID=UPI0012628AB6|nr:VacJ family lipoprotein [Amylibacter sp. SFDW26]KAB7614380.1 VacJ family lipoprotein [Amylibacter sp. SFDW26]